MIRNKKEFIKLHMEGLQLYVQPGVVSYRCMKSVRFSNVAFRNVSYIFLLSFSKEVGFSKARISEVCVSMQKRLRRVDLF
jgi:hypothetical protein